MQGNVITSEQSALIKPGLTRAQVRDVLGSPLLTDSSHADRWDYVFTICRQGAAPQLRRVIVLLQWRLAGKHRHRPRAAQRTRVLPSIDTFSPRATPPRCVLSEEQIKNLPAPQVRPLPEPAPPAPVRIYPPLEPTS